MRCAMGAKKVDRLRRMTGLPLVAALTRGGTDHRVDLILANGTMFALYKDGHIEPHWATARACPQLGPMAKEQA